MDIFLAVETSIVPVQLYGTVKQFQTIQRKIQFWGLLSLPTPTPCSTGTSGMDSPRVSISIEDS
jgi:hypothetical protein